MNYDSFDNIEYQNIDSLYKLCEENKDNFANVKINYPRFNKFFQDSLNFLVETNILSIKMNKIMIEKKDLPFKDYLISKILNSTRYGFFFKEYLTNFEKKNQKLIFKPDLTYNSTTSSLRNFLISMGIIRFQVDANHYVLLEENLLNKVKKIKFSPANLKKQIEMKNEIGLLAEEFIFNYEKEKVLSIDKSLIPEHISKEDVSAGYDILSYEKIKDKVEKIFIEVKAVSSTNFKFYLSQGEYQTALRCKNNYFLYLLPVDHSLINKFDKDKIIKIYDLKKNLFEDKTNWIYENDGYVFYKNIK
jgi:hypothetical protein